MAAASETAFCDHIDFALPQATWSRVRSQLLTSNTCLVLEYGGPVLSDLPGYAVGREVNETDIRRIRGSFFNTISCAEPAHDETECLLIERPGFPLVTLNKVCLLYTSPSPRDS